MHKRLNRPLLSVVIPVYKRRNLAVEAIESVLIQKDVNLDDIEIIVTDDEESNSIFVENREYFLSLFPKITYFSNKFEEGPGGNRQNGFAKARGKYILFLDSDDKLSPFFVSKMVKVLEKEKDFSAVVCLSDSIFDPGFKLFERLKLYPLTLIRDFGLLAGYLLNKKSLFNSSFYLCQISHVIFRQKIIKNQRFNYIYRHGGEDWDFFVQTLEKGQIRIVPRRLLKFRYSPGSSTDNPINREKKWNSYSLLLKNLLPDFKIGVFYILFKLYINLFKS